MAYDVRLVTCAVLPAPDPDTPRLADALERAGARVHVADWRDRAVDWSDALVTVLRSPWDYVARLEEFVAWLRVTAARTELWNPLPLVEWNIHKSYLLDVQAHGAPVVPTVLLLQHSAASLDGVADARGWNTIVVKPAVGVGGIGTARLAVGDPAGQAHLDRLLAAGDVLIQPFVSSVEDAGEQSVVVIDGFATHALRKSPAVGDYRVHEEWGGRTTAAELTEALAELATRVVSVLPATPMYARIDLLRARNGWQVLEIEATEPSLWLDLAPPAATQRFAAAVLARIADR